MYCEIGHYCWYTCHPLSSAKTLRDKEWEQGAQGIRERFTTFLEIPVQSFFSSPVLQYIHCFLLLSIPLKKKPGNLCRCEGTSSVLFITLTYIASCTEHQAHRFLKSSTSYCTRKVWLLREGLWVSEVFLSLVHTSNGSRSEDGRTLVF